MLKDVDFYHLQEKKILDTGLDYIKTASKNVVHNDGKFLGYKIENAVAKSTDDKVVRPDENTRNVHEIIILQEKREEILLLQKCKTTKYRNY